MFSGWICMPLTAAAASTPCSRVSQLQPWAGRLETSESFDMLAGKSLQGYTWFLPNGSISAWIRSVCISINNFLHMFYINRHNCMCHMHGFTSIQLTLFFFSSAFRVWISNRGSNHANYSNFLPSQRQTLQKHEGSLNFWKKWTMLYLFWRFSIGAKKG